MYDVLVNLKTFTASSGRITLFLSLLFKMKPLLRLLMTSSLLVIKLSNFKLFC